MMTAAATEETAKRPTVTTPTESDYKGFPVLTIPTGPKSDMGFGLVKARAILAHLDSVRAFVDKHPAA